MPEPWNSLIAVVVGLGLMVGLPLYLIFGLGRALARWDEMREALDA